MDIKSQLAVQAIYDASIANLLRDENEGKKPTQSPIEKLASPSKARKRLRK